MRENISTSSAIPDMDLELYATLENTWWHILQYYRNLHNTIQTQKRERHIEKPNIPEFFQKMSQLVGVRDYVLVVAIGELNSRYKEGILSLEDIEKSPIHSFFMRVMTSAIQVDLIQNRVRKNL